MSYLRFGRIASAFENQGTPLNSEVYGRGKMGRSSLSLSVEPGGVFAAVAEAGVQLHEQPGIRLAESPLPERFVESISPLDIGARSLVQIIHNSIEPDTGLSADTTFNLPSDTQKYDTCSEAEPAFAATISHILSHRTHYNPSVHSYEVIMSEEQPILLRKGCGEHSALSLVPLTVTGIRYPAGSIMQYNLTRDARNNVQYDRAFGGYTMIDLNAPHAYNRHPLDNNPVRVAKYDEIAQIGFLRVSAFAIDSARQRRKLFKKKLSDDVLSSDKRKALWDLTLDHIIDIAAHAAAKAFHNS